METECFAARVFGSVGWVSNHW